MPLTDLAFLKLGNDAQETGSLFMASALPMKLLPMDWGQPPIGGLSGCRGETQHLLCTGVVGGGIWVWIFLEWVA